MFGLFDSSYKEEARLTIVTCANRANAISIALQVNRPEFKAVMERLSTPQPQSWLRLLTIAHLGHNLMCAALIQNAVAPSRMNECRKTAGFVDQMMPTWSGLGQQAVDEFRDLSFRISGSKNIFPRYGWGRWVVIAIKNQTHQGGSLTSDEIDLSAEIDNQITEPFHLANASFYNVCSKPA